MQCTGGFRDKRLLRSVWLGGVQLEPQFSSKVQELMKLEEAAGKKGQFDRQEKLAQKVDAQVTRAISVQSCGPVAHPVACCVFVVFVASDEARVPQCIEVHH
jgi:hypothetical protein